MRKGKAKNRIIINKIVTMSMVLVLFVISIFTFVALFYNEDSTDVEFIPKTTTYSSSQEQIVNPNTSNISTTTITMTDAYNNYASIGDKTITITNANELYLFSTACNTNANYLSKNYKLLSNIEYDIQNQFIPVGYSGTAFSGTFDGCGFEISNLKMVDITSQISNESLYSNMYYYAMFSVNSGTIQNLGIVESRNTVVSVELENIVSNGGVANLVGKNEGTVQYCYYKDLRDMIDDEIGLAFYGGYRIAGLVYLNNGTFNNSYVAVSTVVNHKITGYESLCGICYQDNNYSQSNNLYYYDGSIDTYRSIAGAIEITYKDEVFSDATFLDANQNVGIYCSSIDDLNSNYLSNNNWYLPEKYDSTLEIYIKNETPILRGLSFNLSDGKYTFAIDDVNDFLYMFELMNNSDFFAGDLAIYQINSDINLLNIEPIHFIYKKLISSSIIGNQTAGNINPTLITGSSSSYPTIYNFNAIDSERKTTTLGIDAYGLFPYLTGSVSYLNIIPDAINLDEIEVTNNVKGIAAVSGYVEKGNISNVNVYITTTHESTDIKEFYLGGIAGILGGEGTISNCTVSGNYDMSYFASSAPIASVYTEGNAIGGVVGYICETYGNISTCLSAVDMNLNFNSSAVKYQIGGVIGAAYTIDASELENLGSINIGTSSVTAKYNALYVSGIIGRHLGVKQQISDFTNQGDITVYGSNASADLYISGIENADILTTSLSTGLIASSDKTKDGKFRFRASSLTNRANIVSASSEVADTVEYTFGINLLTENGFVSELAGVYNLNYKEKYVSSSSKVKTALGEFAIDMNLIHNYSGVVNVINEDSTDQTITTDLTTVYNLRDITISSSVAIAGAYDYEYYGTVKGKFINYYDVRNEGSITANITRSLGSATNNCNIILVGVFEEVSEGCSADNIFNGGDISLTFTGANINGNVYASGICYKNSGYNENTINKYNPFSLDYDSTIKGAMNNVINNGNINIDNPTNFATITYSYETVQSGNGQSDLGSKPITTYNAGYSITGNLNVSGITCINEAPITNTFNLGNLFASNYISSTTIEKEINVAGIIDLNIGQYAYVLNSANNGILKGINLSSGEDYLSNVNVAGIIARNDELEDGTDYTSNQSNPNSKQIVSFTINYGDIYSYNFAYNITSTSAEPKAKSAGILAMGLCNAINVVNYGNVYGSETASGIYGVLYFDKFKDEVTSSNEVSVANTINYGNVYMLSRGYNYVHGNAYYDYSVINYTNLKNLSSSNIILSNQTLGNVQAFTQVARNTDYISVIGSVFSIVNFASNVNANNINIRYLISFNDQLSICGATTEIPSSVSADTSSLYSAYVSTNAATGALLRDSWMGKYVQYSPLITTKYTDRFVTSISQSGIVSTTTETYTGVFNIDFAFRQAINKNSSYYQPNLYVSDEFISDYFQFVQYNYINSVLLDKIGWRAIAVATAANDFAQNLGYVSKTLEKLNTISSTDYNNIVSNALSTGDWLRYLSAENQALLLNDLVTSLTVTEIKDYIEYLFINNSTSLLMNQTTLEQIMEIGEEINPNIDYSAILSSILTYENNFSTLLADSVLGASANSVSLYLNDFLASSELTKAQKIALIEDYISYEQYGYFDYDLNEATRITILSNLFEDIDEFEYPFFYEYLYELLNISSYSTIASEIQIMSGFASLTDAEKIGVFVAMFNNTTPANIQTYLATMASEVGMYSKLIQSGYAVSSMDDVSNKTSMTSSSTDTTVINERIELWNKIRGTSSFATYLSGRLGATTKYYFEATEFNNTYQSVTEPHTEGAYIGDTAENRLSYLYTTDITPAVYFYGPYRTVATNHLSGTLGTNVTRADSNLFAAADEDIYKSTDLMLSRGGKNSTTTFIDAFGVWNSDINNYTNRFNNDNKNGSYYLMYYDLSNEQFGGAIEQYTFNGETFWGMGGTQLNQTKNYADPINGTTSGASDWTGVKFGNYDYTLTVATTGEIISLKNATMTGIYYNTTTYTFNGTNYTLPAGRIYICDENGTYHPVFGNVTVTNNNNPSDTFNMNIQNNNNRYTYYSYLLYRFALKYYTVLNPTYYSTAGYTGIYRHAEHWGDIPYYTWKQSQSNRVATTSYIDYLYTDILNLDGYLTQYDDGTTISNTEVDIINWFFNNYFINDSTNFRRAVEKSLFEASIGANDCYIVTNKLIYDNYNNIYYYDDVNNQLVDRQGNKIIDVTITYTTEYPYVSVVADGYVTYQEGNKIYINKNPDIIGNLTDFISANVYSENLINSNNPLSRLNYSNTQSVWAYLQAKYTSLIDKKSAIISAATDYNSVFEALINNYLSYDENMTDTEMNDELNIDLNINSSNASLEYINATYQGKSYNKAIKVSAGGYYIFYIDANNALKVVARGVTGNTNMTVQIYTTAWTTIATNQFNATISEYKIAASNFTANYAVRLMFSADAYVFDILEGTDTQVTFTKNIIPAGNTDSDYRYRYVRIPSSEEVRQYVSEYEGNEINYNLNYTLSASTIAATKTDTTARYYVLFTTTALLTTENYNTTTRTIIWTSTNTYGSTNTTLTNVNGTFRNNATSYANYFTNYGGRYLYVSYANNNTGTNNLNNVTTSNTVYFRTFTFSITYTKEDYTSILDPTINLDQTLITSEEKQSYINASLRNSGFDLDEFSNDILVDLIPLSKDNTLENSLLKEIMGDELDAFCKYLISNSNKDVFMEYVNEVVGTSSESARKLMQSIGQLDYRFIYSLIISMDNDSKLTNDLKLLIAAAYIVSDYSNIYNQSLSSTSINVSSTKFNTNILIHFDSTYQYISSNGTFDADKYTAFTRYILDEAITASGYGIFALASSRGIENGAFIPDNIDLLSMDVCYDTTASIGSVSIIELTDSINSSWRDNLASLEDYDTTDTTSVNYHIRVEMKQLVKAISNIIFELDLECDDTILYSSVDQMDYEEKIITYYVSEQYLDYIKNAQSLEIIKLLYADTATSNKAEGDYITLNKTYGYSPIELTASSFVASKYYTYDEDLRTYSLATVYDNDENYYEISQIDIASAITIIPEETDYTANYTIRFIKIDTAITSYNYYSMYFLTDEDSTTSTTIYTTRNIPYYGATVTFVVEADLPDGMDLKSFFNITGETKNLTWAFDLNATNNGIISSNIAYISINVDISMSQGSKAFVLNLYGNTRTINIIKDANRNSLITGFAYDGTDYTSSMNLSRTASSTIPFGRAFNYDELTTPYILTTDIAIDQLKTYYIQNGTNGSYSYIKVASPTIDDISTYYEINPDFYLYLFEVSSNATVSITATKEENSETGLMTYTVTYVVRSEYGTTTTYTHLLTEHIYFDDGTVFGTLYKDGVAVDGSGLYTTDFIYDEEEIFASTYSDLIYDEDEDNFVAVIFNRGYEPQYRIRYNLSNFYGDITKYSVTQGEANASLSSPQNTYAGITITIDDDQEPGTYLFNYVYTNTGLWESVSGWVAATSFDPDAVYYFNYGDDEYYSPMDEIGEEITAENFDDYVDYLVMYVSGEDPNYTRTYTFPDLYILKDFATDALFHKLTFLDESIVLGGTASVMLPTTPISAGSNNTDEDSVIYSSVFANYSSNQIIINPNSIEYSLSAQDASVTDYYTVGTVSDTDLENYAPTIKVEDHAQVFKYTTLTKLATYGADNGQTVKDSDILSNREDMLLYIPFVTGTGNDKTYEVFLVLLDENLNWLKVYPRLFNGVDDGTKSIYTYSTTFDTSDAEADPTLTQFTYDGNTYQIADYAGNTDITSDESKNISLYMDYIGDPLEDHFWYISYVVFSEYYLNKGQTDTNSDGKDDLGAVRYYHISIVDASNTVYFDVSLYAPQDFKLDEIYLTFAEVIYNSQTYIGQRQLSCYLEKTLDEEDNYIYGEEGTDVEGLVLYTLKLSMAALPAGYFNFYLDLPNGYGAICYTNKDNELNTATAPGSSLEGSYLPHTTIIPITVGLRIIVSELTGESSSVWAVNTSDLYTRQITYMGKEE